MIMIFYINMPLFEGYEVENYTRAKVLTIFFFRSKAGKRKTKVKKHTLNPVFEEILKVKMI